PAPLAARRQRLQVLDEPDVRAGPDGGADGLCAWHVGERIPLGVGCYEDVGRAIVRPRHSEPLGIGVWNELETEVDVAGLKKRPVDIVEVLADRILAELVRLGLQQQGLGNRLPDLARDRQIGIATVKAILQRRAGLAPAVFPLLRNVGGLLSGSDAAAQSHDGYRSNRGLKQWKNDPGSPSPPNRGRGSG